jgi:hypothetical protein
MEGLNNHSTLAANNSSLEYTACQAESGRSQNTENMQIQEKRSLSGKERGDEQVSAVKMKV